MYTEWGRNAGLGLEIADEVTKGAGVHRVAYIKLWRLRLIVCWGA